MTRLIVAQPHFTYPGGSSAVALETAQRLAADGYDVHVVSIRHLPELTSRFTDLHFHDLGGPLSSDLGYWMTLPAVHRRFYRVVDSLQPDALLAHVFPANYWAFAYRSRRPNIPCVWYCHEPSAFVHDWNVIGGVRGPMRAGVIAANPFLQIIDRWLVRFADAIVANSTFTAHRVEQIYRRSATVANPGVDVDRFAPDTRKERLVLTVGRLTRFKRVDMFIRAAADLKGRGYRNVRWVVAGDGEEATALRNLADELEVCDIVEFAGRLSEERLVDYYNRALVVTVTSIGEPFGIVPVEAMAARAAVVCSDNGGPASTIQDGVSGLHFRSGDVRDFARAVAQLLDDPHRAIHMGRHGRQIAAHQYSWDRTAEGIQAALSRLLGFECYSLHE